MARTRRKSVRSEKQSYEEADDNNDDEDIVVEEDVADKSGSIDDEKKESGARGRRQSSERRSEQRSSKAKVMRDSNQTEEERRALRSAQRELQISITSARGEEIEDAHTGAFEEVREKNNSLWKDVKYTREAVLDGENLNLISSRAARQIDRLVKVPRYDATRLCHKLRAKCSIIDASSAITHFDWRTFGLEVGSCFNSVPSRISFLNGPMDVVYVPKERKKRLVAARDGDEEEDAEEETPEVVHQRKKNDKTNTTSNKDDDSAAGDKSSAVDRHFIIVGKTLKKRCREALTSRATKIEGATHLDSEAKQKALKRLRKHGNEICAVRYLFNPNSFTQTVENIFHFSFLVKMGKAGIGTNAEGDSKRYGIHCEEDVSEGGPFVKITSAPTECDTPTPPRQAIVSLNMQDWRDMCAAFNVTQGDIPDRTESRHV